MSGIEDRYRELLAAGWTPVVPLPVIGLPVPGTSGSFYAYTLTNGVAVVLYDHPDTGTFEVHGAILARYLEIGGPAAFGFPITDEIDDVVGGRVVGRVSHFEGGSIFFIDGAIIKLNVSAPSTVAGGEIVDGIDVSHHQGHVDWTKVRGAGLGFAYIKATDGDGTDPEFADNWSGSAAVLPRGAYHYFHPQSTPDATRAQADHFVDVVARAGGAADLPPMVDVEDMFGVNTDQAIASLEFYLGIVAQGTGMRPIIYTYPDFWTTSMKGSDRFAPGSGLWIASYGRQLGHGEFATRPRGPAMPHGWSDFVIWQHAILRGIPGIGTLVDRNMVLVPPGQTLLGALR